jgi:hypothetical protein
MPNPIPELPPVTSATRPSSENTPPTLPAHDRVDLAVVVPDFAIISPIL